MTVATVAGAMRDLLTTERLVLNLLGRLSGVATLTRRYVEAIAGTRADIYDTRKTTPGWRRLEKYAVRCGGGRNHRTGLFDAVLIKDNHLALAGIGPAEAVRRAREFLPARATEYPPARQLLVEVEVDTLTQLDEVLPQRPDLVLLDNMPPDQLRTAVQRRNAAAPEVELEASGGVNLQTVRAIAETGVERISVGARRIRRSAWTWGWIGSGRLTARPNPLPSRWSKRGLEVLSPTAIKGTCHAARKSSFRRAESEWADRLHHSDPVLPAAVLVALGDRFAQG